MSIFFRLSEVRSIGPKIEKNDLTSQLPQTERLFRIDPFSILWELRGGNEISVRQRRARRDVVS